MTMTLRIGKWYKIAGRLIYVISYTVYASRKPNGFSGRVNGILRKDFSNYICHQILAPGDPVETIAERYHFVFPTQASYKFSDKTKVEYVSQADVFKKEL